MPCSQAAIPLSPDERRREIAAALAKGVVRYRRIAPFNEITEARSDEESTRTGLDFLGDTRLSVSHGTGGLGLPDEGDNA